MHSTIHPVRVLVKGVFLFLVFQFILYLWVPDLGILNIYNPLGLERQRFPTSTSDPMDASLNVNNLDAMVASHIVSLPKPPDEFRVMVFGDSAVWGFHLPSDQTLPSRLTALNLACGNKKVTAYNLSFPYPSATKDLLILDKVRKYQPDLIIWLITWYTLIPRVRVDHVLITENPEEFYKLGSRFNFLPGDYQPMSLLDKILSRQHSLFHVIRYQLYSVIQLATGTDQIISQAKAPPYNLPGGTTFEGLVSPTLDESQVSLDQVQDFYKLAGNTPVLLINEPMLIVSGVPNSDIRYNRAYPRWIYDQYRQYLGDAATRNNWDYLDLWNIFPPGYFTNTPFHLSSNAEGQLAEAIAPSIEKACP